MMLAEEIREAEARVELLKRRALQTTCAEMGEHDWKHIGGRNAACGDRDCSCSVPVYECRRCGVCDYGENEEAKQKLKECAESGPADYGDW